jgi:hypothetical protein
LARFRSINGVTGGDDTPLTESELREIFILSPPQKRKPPTTQLPPILQNPQHKTSRQLPHYYYCCYYYYYFFFTTRAPKHTYQKPKKIQNQILNSCYKFVIPKNKQTTRAKAQQQEIHNKKIQTANAVVTD